MRKKPSKKSHSPTKRKKTSAKKDAIPRGNWVGQAHLYEPENPLLREQN